MGAALESVNTFAPGHAWTTIENSIITTNARNTLTVIATNPSTFYRLRLLGQ